MPLVSPTSWVLRISDLFVVDEKLLIMPRPKHDLIAVARERLEMSPTQRLEAACQGARLGSVGDPVNMLKVLLDCVPRSAVVGGTALVLHGSPQRTSDIDLILNWNDTNTAGIEVAMRRLGLKMVSALPLEPEELESVPVQNRKGPVVSFSSDMQKDG